jgi:hypothetical protein
VQLRRALLLFALVLGLTALATSIAPGPRSGAPSVPAPPPQPGGTTATALAPAGVPTVSFVAPAKPRAPVRAVRVGEHVIVVVTSADTGQASIPALGRTASVQPQTPAAFDLLIATAGRYEVLFTPSLGGPIVAIGTLLARG